MWMAEVFKMPFYIEQVQHIIILEKFFQQFVCKNALCFRETILHQIVKFPCLKIFINELPAILFDHLAGISE